LSHATEHLAEKTGEGIGGLLNATFGNAAELIIALAAMRAGLFQVVKASIVGSIIGNVLLVLGASMLAGGLKFREQKYNAAAARSQASMLALSVFALIFPSLFHTALGSEPAELHQTLSLITAIILFLAYILYLIFQLVTHKKLFAGGGGHATEGTGPVWSVGKSALILGVSTALIAWMSEILVGTVEPAAKSFGMNTIFIGVIIVGIVGNAAEHTAAIVVARKNRMDLSLSIAIGSSIQVTLFIAPLLLFLSYVLAPQPFDLIFGTSLVLVMFLATLIIGQIAGDGESNWLKGMQLLALYLILAIAFFFIPSGMIKPV
jgi:Ca2+:H+ antiporter